MARLPDPWQHADLRSAQPSQEDVRERRLLLRITRRIDVEHDRPGRARLVVVVAHNEGDTKPADVNVAAPPALDEPGQRPKANAVRRATSRHAVHHPAGTDRIAIAGLEVRACDRVRHRMPRNLAPPTP